MHEIEQACTGPDSIEALQLIMAAWEEGTDSGIAPEMMAYAALYTALSDLVSVFGEDNVANLTEGLSQRVRCGEFTLYATRQ